ncbi:FAD-dependent monooxygenase [Massilia solisilvae]|uniref:FAD-dependent monooxygenase n=1 Tax=Massilia solisilvae TaxID=1811225 RepID=A0ABT2BIA3_9BURK|nr:FAD-dependent monooxygenase [Massilia solisilvae]MCS0608248.1 FAD-dependent monooxygenase [Massilia solisilvae]
MYDVVIVGARCAGAALALLLARRGMTVAVLDRDEFPSDTLSGHYLHQCAVARLAGWGLRDGLAALGAPALQGMLLDLDGVVLEGEPLAVDGERFAFCPRRHLFDSWLLEQARAAGAHVHTGVRVDGLLCDAERVRGVVGRSRTGERLEWNARLVVGADGMQSTVARLAGARMLEERPSYACNYYSYWDGLELGRAELYVRGDGVRRFAVAAPTNDGATIINVAWPQEEHERLRGDIEGAYLATLRALPGLWEKLDGATREPRLQGLVKNPNFIRQSAGPGWALIGDAGCHKDPVTAQGMADALRDAEMLADAISLTSGANLDTAASTYEAARNRTIAPMFDYTCTLAQLTSPPPEMRALAQAMQSQPRALARFFGVMAGSVTVPEFFDPANLGAIMQGAPECVP